MWFTVICPRRVIRVKAKSVQALTQALNEVGIKFIGVHDESAPTEA